ncbi:DUF3631 domain-containing protein [Chloroflexota bacterium]
MLEPGTEKTSDLTSDRCPTSEQGTPAGTIPADFNAIPVELLSYKNWVVWRADPPDKPEGKPRKVPVDPNTGKNASTTDPQTWGTFQDAITYSERYGLPGIGFVFTDTPFTGIDMDHCCTDGIPDDWAMDIISRFDSYIETSPSGQGIHIIVEGKLPVGGRRKGDIEVYDDARYFTVTGNRVQGVSTQIKECSAELARFHSEIFGNAIPKNEHKAVTTCSPIGDSSNGCDDSDLITKMLSSACGPKIKALLDGDISAYGNDHSAADLALCSHLAFWTDGNIAQMDQIFRSSGLMRPKWDERRGENTYGQITLEKAIKNTKHSYTTESNFPHKTEDTPKGFDLLDAIISFIRRFVVLSEPQLIAIALWVVHTHAFEVADATPYLNISSPEKRSGKTRLLEILELLVARPWFTGKVTAAVLARKIDAECPTLLLDESDAAFKGEKEYSETLRGILNSGYRRGGKASVCIGQGANISYKDLSTYCPKAIAGIGKLPGTVADRSIPIELKRRAPGEQVERFRRRTAERQASLVREQVQTFASAIHQADIEPDIPSQLNDRAADCWEPLLAIADVAGGEWPQKARQAAITLMAGEIHRDESTGIQLLGDIYAIFRDDLDQLPSNDLVDYLNQKEESPWGDYRGGGLTARKLASFLKPYGISPHNIRTDKKVPKGYTQDDFLDAWKRYLPYNKDLSATSATPASTQLQHNHEIYPLQPLSKVPDVADTSQSYDSYDVADVADKKGETSTEKVLSHDEGLGEGFDDNLWEVKI